MHYRLLQRRPAQNFIGVYVDKTGSGASSVINTVVECSYTLLRNTLTNSADQYFDCVGDLLPTSCTCGMSFNDMSQLLVKK